MLFVIMLYFRYVSLITQPSMLSLLLVMLNFIIVPFLQLDLHNVKILYHFDDQLCYTHTAVGCIVACMEFFVYRRHSSHYLITGYNLHCKKASSGQLCFYNYVILVKRFANLVDSIHYHQLD